MGHETSHSGAGLGEARLMQRLGLKLVRDLRVARWQFMAITLVSALGVGWYHGSMLSYERQRLSYELTYDKLAFADVWIPLRRAPAATVAGLRRVPGVTAVEGRISEILEVEQTGGRRPKALGRLISMPSGREPAINKLRILSGRRISGAASREALLDAQFAKANSYRCGDRIYPRFLGRRVAFTVVGIVTSPEFIVSVPGGAMPVPLPDSFGVLFVPEQTLAPLLGMAGQVNEVVLRTAPGAEARVAAAVKQRLSAYGPETPVLRPEQPSNRLLQSDLEGNKPFLVVMPLLFLGSAALAVGLMLSRWVQAQRGIIGFLRASGLEPAAVLRHYLLAGLAIGVIGGLCGMALGAVIGAWFGNLYDQIMPAPFTADGARPDIALTAFFLSVAACLAGAAAPARQAARIAPADAMRGEMAGRPGRVWRLWLPLHLRLPIRNLLRRPMRTVGTATGIASAVALMIIAGTFRDSMGSSIAESLADFERYNLAVAFVPEQGSNRVEAVSHWPGVLRAEPTLDIPARAQHGSLRKDTVIMGIVADSRLRILRSVSGRRVLPVPGTALFGDVLAKRIDLETGDALRLTYPQNVVGRRASALMRAGTRIRSQVGLPVYMDMEELQRRFASRLQMPPGAVGGMAISADPQHLPDVRRRLYRTEGIGLVLTLQELNKQIADLTAFANTFIAIMFGLGAAMAFAVVYTVTDIVLWERTRELATLRTLGFGMRDVARLVTVENVLVAALGVAMAIYPGIVMARALTEASNTEGFTMALITSPITFIQSGVGVLLVVVIAQWPGLRRIRRMDLAEAIRLRE